MRQRGTSRRLALLLAAALIVAATGGCSGKDRTDGPLTSSLSGGGNSLFAPRAAHGGWHATFGSLLVCSRSAVTLTDVVPHYRRGRPRSIHFFLRSVPAAADRPGRSEAWAPVIARAQSLKELRQRAVRSMALRPVRGSVVVQPCASDPDASFSEVVTTASVGTQGFWIDRLDIGYRSEGRSYRLPVHWSYVACGTATARTRAC